MKTVIIRLCIAGVGIFVLAVISLIAWVGYHWTYLPSHRHCIKGAIMALSSYAGENDGNYPTSERGWGDALLKLNIDSDDWWIAHFTGVDDDGAIFSEALKNGSDIDESQCSRVYVQGLSSDSLSSIAILFDRDSEPGGDHTRNIFWNPLREVVFVGGHMEKIKESQWSEFAQSQRELLKDEGFSEEAILEIYGEPQK